MKRTDAHPWCQEEMVSMVAGAPDGDAGAMPPTPTTTQRADGRATRHADSRLPAALGSYLREIGRAPLLGREQEVAPARRVERGDRAAAHALAEANLRLVVSVARRYLDHGLPLEDLIGEGNLGLLHAVEKYDWRRGYRFSTYAVWWIRQAVVRAIENQGHAIRVPVHMYEALARRSGAMRSLANDLGREPTPQELEAVIGGATPHMAAAALAAQVPLSLDVALTEDGDEHFIDALSDDSAVSPEDRAMRRARADETRRIMEAVLTARECDVLTWHFGLGGAPPEALREVSRRLGVTRERVRQIEAEALRKLRQPLRHLRAS